MLETFLSLVDRSIVGRSGSVFYSGQSAFAGPSDLYILGLNPGGCPVRQRHDTIDRHMSDALAGRQNWSAYQDESWRGKPPGTYGMQPRVLHMLRAIGRDPRLVPSSNVVFVRTKRASNLAAERDDLMRVCWPVHEAVIQKLVVRTVACFGGLAGLWVRNVLNAHRLLDTFVERNERRWTSSAHINDEGFCVITLTHPSIAKWDTPATDPSPLVRAMLNRD